MSTSLGIVENLLNEFYHPATHNQRKREIEDQLTSFKNQPSSWQQCLCVLSSNCCSTNEFLWLFTTSTLEHTISRRWTQLSPQEHSHLRENLWSSYANLPYDVSRRQRDTIAQLIALVGKREFPDDHPEYIKHCIELTKMYFQLGVVLLRTTSEEVVSNRNDVSSDRKQYFQSCITQCMPEIVELLGKYLVISTCHLNGTALSAIPSNIADYRLYTSLPNDNSLSSSILELLQCVQHIFSWIPVDSLLTEYFILALFDLAKWRKEQPEISVAALTTVNELFYLQKAIPFPNTIMTAINGLLDKNNYTKSSEMYEDKFTELLRLSATKFCSKLFNDQSLLDAFVSGLQAYTFNVESTTPLSERLEIWKPLLRAFPTSAKSESYIESCITFSGHILRGMRLEVLNPIYEDETLDENMQTKWQQYIAPCIEVIALVAEMRPNQTFNQVYRLFTRPFLVIIMSIEKAIDNKTFDPTNEFECSRIRFSLREISMLCQTLVRIAPSLDLGSSEEIPLNLCTLVRTLLSAVNFFSSKKFQSLHAENSLLVASFVDLYAQSLLALRSLLAISPAVINDDQLRSLIHTVAQILLPSTFNESALVQMAAAQLLLNIASMIRPKQMLEVDLVVQLVRAGTALPHLPKHVLPVVYEALISSLVFPWKNISQQEQDFGRRSLVLQDYVSCLCQEFLAIDPSVLNNGHDVKISAITAGILPIITEIINYFNDTNSAVKEMLLNAFKPTVHKAMNIFNAVGFDSNEIATTVSDFALSVLRTLQNQLGMAFVREMITLFINSSTRGEMTVRRLKSMEKILQMFQLIVQQPGSETMSLIPSILNLTLDHILPLLSYDNNLLDYSDVAHLMYTLFDSILNYRWQYFYKTNVQSIILNGSANSNNSNDHVQHPEQFLAIFNSYGQALVIGNDPNITSTVLVSLQNLNERWKLFHRALFKTNLLTSFQCALINALLSAEGALHFDVMSGVLFSMGQVDKLKLHESFMSIGFTATNSKVIEEICLATDIPTFSQKMSQLIQDTRCTRLSQ
ncbi:exportin-6 [Eupeodes corollae]|uniref:exportin-6 n=1 Tax=Eupeodes corollae TaxID=290404 RepID=UPI002490BB16|nr:exportin-6 [Eupeodes corollae]